MSMKSRKRSKEQRAAKKRAMKEANRAKYQAWRDAGQNGKRAKVARRKKRRGIRIVSHRLGPCGNAGCMRCHPSAIRAARVAARKGA